MSEFADLIRDDQFLNENFKGKKIDREQTIVILKKLPEALKKYVGSDEIKDQCIQLVTDMAIKIASYENFAVKSAGADFLNTNENIYDILDENDVHIFIRILQEAFRDTVMDMIPNSATMLNMGSQVILSIVSKFFSVYQEHIRESLKNTENTDRLNPKELLILETISDFSVFEIFTVFGNEDLSFKTHQESVHALDLIKKSAITSIESVMNCVQDEKMDILISPEKKIISSFLMSVFGSAAIDTTEELKKYDISKIDSVEFSRTVISFFLKRSSKNINDFLYNNSGVKIVTKTGDSTLKMLVLLEGLVSQVINKVDDKNTIDSSFMFDLLTNFILTSIDNMTK